MASAGSLTIEVLANTQKLMAGMKKAERTVGGAAKKMAVAMKGFAAVFISQKLIRGINDSIASLDKLNKTASKLGTTTEQLSSLGYAAERAGVSANTFEMAMQRMTRRVAEAAQGTGEAKGALKELGIEAKNLNSLSLENKMALLADAFKGVKSDSDKLRIAFKLFDSEGAVLVNLLSLGSVGLKNFQKQSKDLGNTIKQSLADEASKATDSLTNFNAATQAMSNSLLTYFLPSINAAAFALQDFLDIPRQKGLEELRKKAKELKEEMKDLQQQISNPNFWQKALNTNVARTNLSLLTTELKNVEEKIVSMGEKTQNKPVFKALVQSSSEFSTKLQALQANLDPVGTQFKKYYEDLALLDEALKKGAISQADYNHMLNNLNNSMPQVNTNIKDTKKSLDAAHSASQTFASGMTSAFRQAMDGATNFGDIFANIAKDIVAQLIHILVVQQAVNAAMAAMGFGGGSGGGAGTAKVAGKAASGGITRKGGSYLVGEKGPEIVTLPGNSNITPNGGSMGTTVNVYNNTSSQVDVQEDEAGKIDIIISKITNDVVRGTGPFGSALESRYGLSKV